MNEQENSVSFFRFEDLRVYSKALDYSKWLQDTTYLFPIESNTLKEGILKSAHAIVMNIAEGSARNKLQFVYYLKMAKSAIRECVVYTELSAKTGLMNDEDRKYSRTQLVELTKMIGSLVSSLQRTMPNSKSDDPDEID